MTLFEPQYNTRISMMVRIGDFVKWRSIMSGEFQTINYYNIPIITNSSNSSKMSRDLFLRNRRRLHRQSP